jgi:16S rRNA (guanine966-N2)-methyltransferase
MARNKSPKRAQPASPQARSATPPTLRIIGGKFRGSKLEHHGDMVTRPMKDRTREAVFNLLGPKIKGAFAVDLFAGTGALALEAISRGAEGAVLCERHFPTAKIIDRNIAAIGAEAICEVVRGDTFRFSRLADIENPGPWVVFCSPPYDLFVEQRDGMIHLIDSWIELSPPGSLIVVESDSRFDCDLLPDAAAWDVRRYMPAQIAIVGVDELNDRVES